ncbi:MAG: tail fiber domain-containing protein [Rhodothermales bacterium]
MKRLLGVLIFACLFVHPINSLAQWTDTGSTIYTTDKVVAGRTTNQYGSQLEIYGSSNPFMTISGALSGGGTAGFTASIASTAGAWSNFSTIGDYVIRSIGSSSEDLILSTRNSNGGAIRFGTGTTSTEAERMTITSDGKVGIGTSSPTVELDVDGVGRFAGVYAGYHLSVNSNDPYDPMFSAENYYNTESIWIVSGPVDPVIQPSCYGCGWAGTSYEPWERVYTQSIYRTNEYTLSDARLKSNIATLANPLKTLRQLRGVSFYYDATEMGKKVDAKVEDLFDSKRHLGFLAQEVQEVLPELVDSGDDFMSVSYEGIIPVLVEAVKAQQQQIEFMARVLSENGIEIDLESLSSTGVDGNDSSEDGGEIGGLRLDANYPNPASRTTSIRFELPENQHADLAIFDLTGRKVSQVVDADMAAGPHEISWDVSSLPSGVYFYRLVAGGDTRSAKITVTR